jgi:ferritin-like metal-binding protein YciE
MATAHTLEDLFHETLKDIYFAERQILKALPKMIKASGSEELRAALEQHREETEGQVDRLEKVFEIIGKRPSAKTCEAIKGILEEGEEVMDDFKGTPTLEAGLIASGQAVEHYEMARYGTLKRWAEMLGHSDAAKLLDETLQQEKAADQKLSKLAEKLNMKKAA